MCACVCACGCVRAWGCTCACMCTCGRAWVCVCGIAYVRARIYIQASTAVRFSARSGLHAGYWPTCLIDGHNYGGQRSHSIGWKLEVCVVLPSCDRWQQCVREAPLHAYSVDGTTPLIGRCARERSVLLQSSSMVSCRRKAISLSVRQRKRY